MASSPVKRLNTIAELRAWRKEQGTRTVAFVPTMGALHEGHLSLVMQASGLADVVIASIFVNQLQFGKNEDFDKYPRVVEQDIDLLKSVGVNAVFTPSADEMYPTASTFVVEENLTRFLCGAFRPGHFKGVTTVVMKLLNLVQPDIAIFGQKDAQQVLVIEKMVEDLNLPVKIVRGPTIREKDGLALSSRNAYLKPEEREAAPLLFKSLVAAKLAYEAGERDALKLTKIGRSVLEKNPAFQLQYWEIRHPKTLQLLTTIDNEGALMAVATYLGKTRLIDNILI
jgi:pantoate--beta-alanine ligase